MKMALGLLLGSHNDYYQDVITKANKYWQQQFNLKKKMRDYVVWAHGNQWKLVYFGDYLDYISVVFCGSFVGVDKFLHDKYMSSVLNILNCIMQPLQFSPI